MLSKRLISESHHLIPQNPVPLNLQKNKKICTLKASRLWYMLIFVQVHCQKTYTKLGN